MLRARNEGGRETREGGRADAPKSCGINTRGTGLLDACRLLQDTGACTNALLASGEGGLEGDTNDRVPLSVRVGQRVKAGGRWVEQTTEVLNRGVRFASAFSQRRYAVVKGRKRGVRPGRCTRAWRRKRVSHFGRVAHGVLRQNVRLACSFCGTGKESLQQSRGRAKPSGNLLYTEEGTSPHARRGTGNKRARMRQDRRRTRIRSKERWPWAGRERRLRGSGHPCRQIWPHRPGAA